MAQCEILKKKFPSKIGKSNNNRQNKEMKVHRILENVPNVEMTTIQHK